MSLPGDLLPLVCLLYMTHQVARTRMEPSVASTTMVHRAGLRTVIVLVLGVRGVVFSCTIAVDAEANTLIDYLIRKNSLHDIIYPSICTQMCGYYIVNLLLMLNKKRTYLQYTKYLNNLM